MMYGMRLRGENTDMIEKTVAASSPSSAYYRLVYALLLLAQLAAISWAFPITELLTDTPFTYRDHPTHLYRITVSKQLAEEGEIIGYDPYFSAGSPAGITENAAAKIPAFMAVLGVDPVIAWKLYAFVTSLLAPGMLVIAAALLGLSRKATAWVAVIALLFWWASIFRMFYSNGLVSFNFASYFAIPFLALVHRYATHSFRNPGSAAVSLGVLGGIATIIHPLFPILVAAGSAITLWINRRSMTRRSTALIFLVVPAVVLATNWFWFEPVFFTKPYVWVGYGGHLTEFNPSLIWYELAGIWASPYFGSKMYLLCVIGGIAAWLLVKSREARAIIVAFGLSGIFLILFAALGAAIPGVGGLTQPNRFGGSGYLFIAIPAAIGLSRLDWRPFARSFRVHLWATIPVALLLAYNINEMRRELSYAPIPHYGARPPEVRGLQAKSAYILDWLKTHTDRKARILFETSNSRFYDTGHLAGVLALWSGRAFIGGPLPMQFYAGFWDHTLFGRDISEFTPDEFMRHMAIYNVGWIIAYHKETKSFLEGFGRIRKVDDQFGISFYEVELDDYTHILQGEGRLVSWRTNRLEFSGLEGDKVILKFHYMEGLRCTPQCDVRPVQIGDDPTPFIELTNPPSRLILSWGG